MPLDTPQLGNDPSGQETGDVTFTIPSEYGNIVFSAPRGTPRTQQALAPYIVPRYNAMRDAALANQATNAAPAGSNDPASPSVIATPTVDKNSFATLMPDEATGRAAQILAQSRAIERANTQARERLTEEAAASAGGIAGGMAAGALISGMGPEAAPAAGLLARGGAALARGGIRAAAMGAGMGTGQAVGSAYADAALKAGESLGYIPKMEDQKVDQVWTRAHDQFINGAVTGTLGEATFGTARIGRNLIYGLPSVGPALKALEGRVADAAAQKIALAIHNVSKNPIVESMRKVLAIFPIVGDAVRKNETKQIGQANARFAELFVDPFVPLESVAALSDRAINGGGMVKALFARRYSAASGFYQRAEDIASKGNATWNPVDGIGGTQSLRGLALDLLDAERNGAIPSLQRTFSRTALERSTTTTTERAASGVSGSTSRSTADVTAGSRGQVTTLNPDTGGATIDPFGRILEAEQARNATTMAAKESASAGTTKSISKSITSAVRETPTTVPTGGDAAGMGDFIDALANMPDGTKLNYQQMSQLGRALNDMWRRAGKIGDGNLINKVGQLKAGFGQMLTNGTDSAANQAFLDANRAFASEMQLYERPTARKLEDIYSNVFTQQRTMIPNGSYPDQLFENFFTDPGLMKSPAAHADLRELVGDSMYKLGIANHLNNRVVKAATKSGGTIAENWDAVRASMGLLPGTNTPQLDSLKAMLSESGLDKKGVTPEAMSQFLKVVQEELPDTLPDLSSMQLRRAVMGGKQSLVALGLAGVTLGASPFLQWSGYSHGPATLAVPLMMAVSMNRIGSWMTDPAKLAKVLAYARAPASSGFKTQVAIQATRWAAEDLAHSRAYAEGRVPSESDIHDAEADIRNIPAGGGATRPTLRHPEVMR